MHTNTAHITDTINQWEPRIDGLTDDWVTSIKERVIATGPRSVDDAASLLSAAARFVTDLLAAGVDPVWSDITVDVWVTRVTSGAASSGVLVASTAGRYRTWLRRIVRAVEGRTPPAGGRQESFRPRGGVSPADIGRLMEVAGGTQWLWWCVVVFGAGWSSDDAAAAVVHDDQVTVGGVSHPVVGVTVDVTGACPGSNWLGFRRWCERHGVAVTTGGVSDTYTNAVVTSDWSAVEVLTGFGFGHNRIDAALKRNPIDITDEALAMLR